MRKSAAQCISDFSSQIGITINDISTPILYNYLVELYNEAYTQFDGSGSQLPILKTQSNFPNIYPIYSGSGGNDEAAFHSMIGWMFACQLAELKPSSRNTIFTKGYEFGGYKTSDGTNLYGYTFNYDPIVNRIVGGFIYVAMRGLKKPNIENMRAEVYGSRYGLTLNDCYWETDSETESGLNAFYIDLREFLPSAPGPYASDYSNRQNLQNTIGDNVHDNTFKIPEVDYQIYNEAFTNYRLDNPTYKAATIQAIADNDAELTHIFGADNKGTYDGVTIKAVFGPSVIGDTINPSSNKAQFLNLCMLISSAARDSLLSKELSPPQYGRCRPGNSWTTGRIPANSSSNGDNSGRSGGSDYYNISVNAQIDDWDGHPTGYYDQNGNWITGGTYSSPEDYESSQKSRLDPTSYPSGHSSGITGIGMALSEIYPNKTDKILKAVNQFAVNRTIIKYHWNSDTLIGRLIGTAGNAIAHAASDYDNLLSDNSNPGGNNNPGGNEGGESLPLDTERPAMIISPNSGDLVTVSMASSITDDNDLEIDIDWGGVGSSPTIRWKRDIIDTINYLIKPIKDLNIDGQSYNLLTSYSYFHNDICYDLKWLWAYYELLRTNYELLLEYKEDVEDWEENEYDPFVILYNNFNTQYNNFTIQYNSFNNQFNTFSTQYNNFNNQYNSFSTQYENSLNALNNGGPYYIYSGMSEAVYYTWDECATYNYNLPGARHTTDIKDEGDDTEGYSLSFNLTNVTMSYVSGQKSLYDSGDSVTVSLSSNSGYVLPSSVQYSGCTLVNYSLNGTNTSATLTITINNNASVTVAGVASGEPEEPEADPPGSITFEVVTQTYSTYVGARKPRQIPTIVYPNNESSSNYTITYEITSGSSYMEWYDGNSELKVISLPSSGIVQVTITATMTKNSDNSIICSSSYSINLSKQNEDEYKNFLVTLTNNTSGRLWVQQIIITNSDDTSITLAFQYNDNINLGIAPGSSKDLYLTPDGHYFEIAESKINAINASSNIYAVGSIETFSNTTQSIGCSITELASDYSTNGHTFKRIKVATTNLSSKSRYSTVDNIISEDDNKNDSLYELNEAYLLEKSLNKNISVKNNKKNDGLYGEHWVTYYTWEECAQYNYNLPDAIHTTDVKIAAEAQYAPVTMPSFPSLPGSTPSLPDSPPSLPDSPPSLPGPMPQISPDFDESLEPIEYFTYTWDKGIITYNMPYEYINMTDYISYEPNIQNTWQTLSYSMLKWKNNQVDDHPALLYEFIDFDD